MAMVFPFCGSYYLGAGGEHEKRTGGQRDENWPDWYAEYMVREREATTCPCELAVLTIAVVEVSPSRWRSGKVLDRPKLQTGGHP
jgi:hypothetical protein